MWADRSTGVEVNQNNYQRNEAISYSDVSIFDFSQDVQQTIVHEYGIDKRILDEYIRCKTEQERTRLLSKNRKLYNTLSKVIKENNGLKSALNKSLAEWAASATALKLAREKAANEKRIVLWAKKWTSEIKAEQMATVILEWPKTNAIKLPDSVINNPYFQAALVELGWKIVDWKFVFANAMLYREKKAKLEKYVSYVEFLSKPNTSLSDKIKNFDELLQNSEEFIKWKEMILLDYMKNISKDLSTKKQFIAKDTLWNYTILSTSWESMSTIAENRNLLDICNKNNANRYLDFVMMYDIVEWNEGILDKGKEVTQKKVVNTLLKKHAAWIVRKNNVENILAPWTVSELKSHLDEKVKTWPIQDVKEITYLLSIVEKASLPNAEKELEAMFDQNKNTFNDVNTFKRYVEVKKWLVDFAQGSNMDLSKPLTEENIGDLVKSEAMKVLPLAMLASIILLIWGYKKMSWGILLWLIWAIAWGGIMWRMQKKGITSNPHSIDIKAWSEFGANPESVAWDKNTQDLYKSLTDLNDKNGKEEDSVLPTVSDNYILWGILKKLHTPTDLSNTNDILIEDLESWNYNNVYKIVLWESMNPTTVKSLWIEGLSDAYQSRNEDGSINWKVNQEEIKNFIKLLLTKKEDGDETLADLLEKGKYISNRPYESARLTWQGDISEALNKVIKDAYSDTSDVKIREKLNRLKDAHTSTLIGAVWWKVVDVAKWALDGSNKDDTQKILDMIAYVENEFEEDSDFSTAYTDILKNYKLYLEELEKLEEHKWALDETYDTIIAKILEITPGETIDVKKHKAIADFWEDIVELKKIQTSIKRLADEWTEPFKKMNDDIKKVIAHKEKLQKNLKTDSNLEHLDAFSNPNLLQEERVKMAKDLLENETETAYIRIRNDQTELKNLIEDTNIDSVLSVENSIEKYGTIIKKQEAFLIASSEFTRKPWDQHLEQYERIDALLAEYSSSKEKVQEKLEKPIVKFYQENTDKKQKLDEILPGTDFADDIKKIEDVEKFLWENGEWLDVEWHNAINTLRAEINRSHLALELALNSSSPEWTTDPSTPTITTTVWEDLNNAFESTKTFFSGIASGTTEWVSSSANSVENKITELWEKLVEAGLTGIKSDLSWTYKEVKAKITNKSRDKIVANATTEWKKVFDTFLDSEENKTTLQNIKDSVKEKKQEVRDKIMLDINTNYSPEKLNEMNSEQLITAYKKLEKMRAVKYFNTEEVKDIDKLQNGYKDSTWELTHGLIHVYMDKTPIEKNDPFYKKITIELYWDSTLIKEYLDEMYSLPTTNSIKEFDETQLIGSSIYEFMKKLEENAELSEAHSVLMAFLPKTF